MTALSRAAAPSASHNVATGLGRLHVRVAGAGAETVVLWPSILTDHKIHDGLARRLGASLRFVLIDGPGHGQSAGPRRDFTMQECAEAMALVMDHVGLAQAVVGGTSWGGIAAAHLALAHPERVTALVLMNTPMDVDRRHPGPAAHLIAAGTRRLLRTEVFRNGVARSFFSPEVLAADPGYAAAFHSMLKQANAAAMAAAVRSVILRGTPLRDRMAEITVPVLVIAGSEDAMYPVARQEAAARLAPKATFATVGGKHISAVERPDEVAAALAGFLAQQGVRGLA